MLGMLWMCWSMYRSVCHRMCSAQGRLRKCRARLLQEPHWRLGCQNMSCRHVVDLRRCRLHALCGREVLDRVGRHDRYDLSVVCSRTEYLLERKYNL